VVDKEYLEAENEPPSVKRKPSPHGQRGKRGKAGPQGPKGDTGEWPSEAYDVLQHQITRLRNDLDDLRAVVASLQENSRPKRYRSE
jgi:hypothetical protein